MRSTSRASFRRANATVKKNLPPAVWRRRYRDIDHRVRDVRVGTRFAPPTPSLSRGPTGAQRRRGRRLKALVGPMVAEHDLDALLGYRVHAGAPVESHAEAQNASSVECLD